MTRIARLTTGFVVTAVVVATLFVVTSVIAPPLHAQESEIRIDQPSGLGDHPLALEAWQAWREQEFIRARELAETILGDNPDDHLGHLVLGGVYHHAEAYLPQALYHLERSRELFEARFGDVPVGPERVVHVMTLLELAWLTGAMGRHEEKLERLAEVEALYDLPVDGDRGWPLMRLRRYDEARAAIERAIASDNTWQADAARTALCAVEAESHHREAAWDACRAAADVAFFDSDKGPTVFTNAAEAALGMLEFAAAENFMLEGTDRLREGTVSNPWRDLLVFYLGAGRSAEALDAMRRMISWRNSQPPTVHVQNRTELEMAAAALLIVAGQAEDASRLTSRTLDRPDRTGFTSSETEQMQAAAAILDALAQRVLAERKSEAVAWSRWDDAWVARGEAMRHRWRSWLSSRRAAAAMAEPRILHSTVRPYLAGSIEMSEWLEGELVRVLGAGPVAAAVDEARRVETLAGAEGYFAAYDVEVAVARGAWRAVREAGDEALARLPAAEQLIRAQVTARLATAARKLGDGAEAMRRLDEVMQLDPGVIRRLGLNLPVVIQSDGGPVAEQTARYLRRSPRFDVGEHGFRVQLIGDDKGAEACLLDPNQTILACGVVTPRAGDAADELPRRLAAELHEQAFAPRLDLTQADLHSLDGAPVAGGRRGQRLRTILEDDVVETPGTPD
ncbi:MAG: tetratricopeptide repeat protein [Acidobacteriota bacterium]